MILLIGNGSWGKIYAQNLSNLNISFQIANRDNWQELVNQQPAGVIIATPPQSHIEIASFALDRNIPVLIEKPLAMNYKEAKELQKYTAPILVNHIHLFSDNYQQLKKEVINKKINSIHTLGYNKSPNQTYSSLLDYGAHDIAMILDLTQQYPQIISAKEERTEFGFLYHITLLFDKFYSESIVGNGGEDKKRDLTVIQNDKALIYNGGDNPLENTIKTFQKLIAGGSDERAGLDLSLKVMMILDTISEKLK